MTDPPPSPTAPPPDATLFIAPGCPHCATVLDGLLILLKEGALARLEVINAAADPKAAEEAQVRSVPWFRLGRFAFDGAMPLAKLRDWLALNRLPDATKATAIYFDHLFAAGKRQQVERMARRQPELLAAFATLLADEAVEINTRLGVGAVLEELRGSGAARLLAPAVALLLAHPDPRIRGDAAHYASLCENLQAVEGPLRALLHDPHPDVREIAAESLESLAESATENDHGFVKR